MECQPIRPVFKGYYPLTDLYRKGKIPITKGFYGGEINKYSFSVDHLLARSKGGKSELDNLVICNTFINSKKGDRPLTDYFNPKAFKEYCEFMSTLRLKNFNGAKYIEGIKKTVSRLLKHNKDLI